MGVGRSLLLFIAHHLADLVMTDPGYMQAIVAQKKLLSVSTDIG